MFITLEGIEGSGKTFQTPKIVEFFWGKGHACVDTREPGGTAIGQKIRAILLDPENKNLASKSELLLYMADRAQHIDEVIKPALEAGKIVVCDRYFDATVVYQGIVRGLGDYFVELLHKIILDNLVPDLTLLFDVSAEVGLTRAKGDIDSGNRDESETRFEQEKIEFHEEVRQGYLTIARKNTERFEIINAGESKEFVWDQIAKVLWQRLRKEV
ncbi:dTMP kinase [Patescibacteria group bacterium]